MREVDVTIIGGGPVGLFAAFYAGLRGMSVRIVDSLPELGGQLTALYPEKYVYDMPGFPKVLAKDLAREMAIQGLQFGAETVLGETATDLIRCDGGGPPPSSGCLCGECGSPPHPGFQCGEGGSPPHPGYLIRTDKGSELPTRTVIISAGAGAFTPTRIGVHREADFEGRGIHYGVREKSAFVGKDIVIVGGGDSAFDWCLNLEPIARSITLVHRRDQFRAHEDSIQKVLASQVRMKLWNTVKELHGETALHGVTIENSQTKEQEHLPTDSVIVNIGFKSSLGPIKEWGFRVEKAQIVVDERYETGLPGVYAVGDVCTLPGKLKLIATGVGEATMAVCYAKMLIDPSAKLFPGHSSEMDLATPMT